MHAPRAGASITCQTNHSADKAVDWRGLHNRIRARKGGQGVLRALSDHSPDPLLCPVSWGEMVEETKNAT